MIVKWNIFTREAKYSVDDSFPPLALITSVNAARIANISLCKKEFELKFLSNL